MSPALKFMSLDVTTHYPFLLSLTCLLQFPLIHWPKLLALSFPNGTVLIRGVLYIDMKPQILHHCTSGDRLVDPASATPSHCHHLWFQHHDYSQWLWDVSFQPPTLWTLLSLSPAPLLHYFHSSIFLALSGFTVPGPFNFFHYWLHPHFPFCPALGQGPWR